MNTVQLALKNILKNPLNLLMSTILFGLGVGLITFLLLLNDQLKDKFDKNLAGIDLVVGAKGSPLQMILCNMYHIDNPTGNIPIQYALPLLREGHPLIKMAVPLSLGDNYKSYRIVGTNHDFLGLYQGQIRSGKLWKNDLEVTIGNAVAEETGLKLGDTFESAHGLSMDDHVHEGHAFVVTGILEGTGSVLDQLILTNTASIWKVHDHEDEEHEHDEDEHHEHHDHDDAHQHDNSNADLAHHPENEITSVLIQFKNKTNFQALNFGRNINENTEMQAASPAIEINRLYNMIGIGTDVLKGLAILIATVSGLFIFILLLKSMRERRYELAIMRVLGAGRMKLFTLIITEGMILALLGYLTGMILGHAGMELVSKFLKDDFRYVFTGLHWMTEEVFILIIAVVLGLIAAFIPAIQAAKTDLNTTLSKK